MAWLQTYIESGRIVNLMAAVVAVEVLALLWWRRRTGGGIATLPLLANIGAGTCLMFALRAALVGDGAMAIAGWLLGSLACHVADLALRWQRTPTVAPRPRPGAAIDRSH